MVSGSLPSMKPEPFSASGKSFEIHEWRGSGPATLHVHYSDDEAWHVLEGELTFRYADRTETVSVGGTVFVPGWRCSHLHCGVGRPLPDHPYAAIERLDRSAPRRPSSQPSA